MGKLHELLSVETGRKTAWAKILDETARVFKDKSNLFKGQIKRLDLFQDQPGGDREQPEERLAMNSTVAMKLNYLAGFVEEYLDVVYQKELTNQTAIGELQLNGKTHTGLPATFLLGLEAKLERFRKVCDRIPTHAPGIEWEADETHEFTGVVKTKHPLKTTKTKKSMTPIVMYEARFPKTGEGGESLPAQVKELVTDEVVGEFTTTSWSGMLSPAQKSQLLKRVDKTIETVKKARMKANEVKVVESRIAEDIMDYILGDDIRSAGDGVPALASDVGSQVEPPSSESENPDFL